MDTWAYYPGLAATASNAVEIRTADIRIVKSAAVTTAPRGGRVTYTLTITNLTVGTPGQPLTVRVTDPLPSWATGSMWTCASGCGVPSGTGALDTAVTLTNQTPVVINVVTSVNPSNASGSSVVNTASVSRADDATDPILTNNTSSVTLTVRDAVTRLNLVKSVRNLSSQPPGTASSSVTGLPGDQLEYVIRYTNTGDLDLPNLVLTDTLATNLTPIGAVLVCPNSMSVLLLAVQSYAVALNSSSTCGSGTLVPAGAGGTLTITARVR
ncbi:hypothetical protein ACFFLM_15140 [Deinococcus oregonensis]|uniref:DUF11 domain-containing protein n=1 Tax=Deinococcus oregonensis TaxID=1805970 RepID=A0ABV6B242_9DEIO